MAEYIDRKKLNQYLHETMSAQTTTAGMAYVKDLWDKVLSLPAADVAPIVHAQWIYRGEEKGYQCSACQSFCLINYEIDWCKSECCPNCGAKMDG